MSFGEIFSTLITFGAGLVSGILVSYSQEKAKNLAIKQDIGRITQEIENVKHQNNLLLEEVKGRHQLRLAALDRRLQAHQEAFALWRNLAPAYIPDNEKLRKVIIECQEWWDSNCLYLSIEAREGFRKAYIHAGLLSDVLLNDNGNAQEILKHAEIIKASGDAIVRGAELPPLQDESKILNNS